MTTCLRRMRRVASATRSGSSASSGKGLGGGDGAEAAGAGAAVAADHEGGRAFAPAFPVVGARRALADGVQPQLVQQRAGVRETIGRGQTDAQPVRQPRARRGRGGSSVRAFFFSSFVQKSASWSGPKSASISPSTSITGRQILSGKPDHLVERGLIGNDIHLLIIHALLVQPAHGFVAPATIRLDEESNPFWFHTIQWPKSAHLSNEE